MACSKRSKSPPTRSKARSARRCRSSSRSATRRREFDDLALEDLRLYNRALAPEEVAQMASASRAAYLIGKPAAERDPKDVQELYDWWLGTFDKSFQELTQHKRELEATQAAIKSRATIAHVMQEKTDAPMAHVLFRGEYDKRRDQVTADTPDVLPPYPTDQPRDRLGFAHWLLRADQPLPARVTRESLLAGSVRHRAGENRRRVRRGRRVAVASRVARLPGNRVPRQSAGTSSSSSAKWCSRPLIASRPRSRPRSSKRIRRIACCRAARGSAWMAKWCATAALAASGLLVPVLGGPSVRPYQPDGVWEAVAMIGSDTRNYKHDAGDKLYRRSLYTFWKRAAPPASMEIFNAPSRETCTVRRERTNTPLQALVTLNDPQFIEAPATWPNVHCAKGATPTRHGSITLRGASWRATLPPKNGRWSSNRWRRCSAFIASIPTTLANCSPTANRSPSESLDTATLAGWTMLANEVMNLDEVLNK